MYGHTTDDHVGSLGMRVPPLFGVRMVQWIPLGHVDWTVGYRLNTVGLSALPDCRSAYRTRYQTKIVESLNPAVVHYLRVLAQYQPLLTQQSLCFQNQLINSNLLVQEEVGVEVEEGMERVEEEVEEGVAIVEARKEASLLIEQYTR